MYVIIINGRYLGEHHLYTFDKNEAKQASNEMHALSYYWDACEKHKVPINYKVEATKVSIRGGTMPVQQAKDAFRELYTIALHPQRSDWESLNYKQNLYGYEVQIDYIASLLKAIGLSNGAWFHAWEIRANFWQCGYAFELIELMIELDSSDYEFAQIPRWECERLNRTAKYIKSKLKISLCEK